MDTKFISFKHIENSRKFSSFSSSKQQFQNHDLTNLNVNDEIPFQFSPNQTQQYYYYCHMMKLVVEVVMEYQSDENNDGYDVKSLLNMSMEISE